jgi:hypothetical protein
VTDGDTHRDIALDPGQIRAGKYTYAPLHGDIGLRLILYAKDLGVAGDAVRVAALPNTAVARENRPQTEVGPAPPASASRVAVPPSTVHEVQPRIPGGVRSRIRGRVEIPVEVEVSGRGRVVRAVAETQTGDSVRRYLAEQAQKAALQWRFRPARTRSGARVPASTTIRFVFTP